ncbi:hypothetical protein EI94DRAFT_954336 [Lactarius quietus]|nr:hypothetical protein EI94DRAFT_954336 [Lactarius quietus]
MPTISNYSVCKGLYCTCQFAFIRTSCLHTRGSANIGFPVPRLPSLYSNSEIGTNTMSSSLQEPFSSTESKLSNNLRKGPARVYEEDRQKLDCPPTRGSDKGCNSPEAILTVLEGEADELNRSRNRDERLTKWLNPTVNILSALSETLGQGAGLVSYRNQAAYLCLTLNSRYFLLPQSYFPVSAFSS